MVFHSLKLSTRLGFVVAMLLLFLVAAGAFSMSRMHDMQDSLDTVYSDRVIPLKQLKEVADAYAVSIVDTAHKVRDGALTGEQGLKAVAEARGLIERRWKEFTSTFLVPEEKRLIAQLEPLMGKADQAVQRMTDLIRANDMTALAHFTAKDLYPAIDPVSEGIGKLIDLQLAVAASEFAKGHAVYQN
ncbi:MAG TPA: MCP four helix bundle domain-containing protein, partial [Burkholderiaceae bacterium]|nr:MCP four helix bundle domain-containing protein [Burkholderiaceae bacterium]